MVLTATALAAGLLSASSPAVAKPQGPPKNAANGWAEAADTKAKNTKTKLKPSAIPKSDRKAVLGSGYAKSADRAVTLSGDGTGLHVLTGRAKDGYGLKTTATLFEAGFASDTWIGNHCVTESGKYAAVAYAPRMFTNKPELMVRGAFGAIVNLDSGKVTKLPFQSTLAYFNPGCGNGDTAVFSQLTHDGDEKQQTRLIVVDAATGKTKEEITKPGQVTSAIPVKDGIVAAHGNRLVRFNGSKETELLRTKAVPIELHADADGGVTFIDRDTERTAKQQKNSRSRATYLTRSKVKGTKVKASVLAGGKLGSWDLTSSASGTVVITGKAKNKAKLPATVANPGGIHKDAHVTTLGRSALRTAWSDDKTTLINPEDAAKARPARVTLKALNTGKTAVLDVRPATKEAAGASPALPQARTYNGDGGGAKAQGGISGPVTTSDSGGMSTQTVSSAAVTGFTDPVPGDPHNPSEKADERTCSVPRNDVKLQAFQPTPRQVEWAVDQAIVGELNLGRGSNWKNTGVGGYYPQSGMFPAITLAGDPNGTLDNEDAANDKWHIPAQVMLGITAQESNMWQATRFAVPGVTANSLIGNYYGVDYAASGEQNDAWRINWFDADCGYGITQATDGMRLDNKGQPTTLSPLMQKAVAVDYTANIAAGVQILSKKWNETYNAGMTINGGNPRWIENWFFALWAYNSGFYPTADSAGHWGVGWTNNPANPLWKANRVPFLQSATDLSGDDYSHAAHPQDWPYQEKVIGWAARPLSAMFAPGDFQAGYRAAWWNSNYDRSTAKPPVDLFCDDRNFCDPSKIRDGDSNDPGQGACTLDSGDSSTNPHWLHCWWKDKIDPLEWKICQDGDAQCGYAVHRFNTTYPEQPDAASYPPRCTSGLDANALIVDDLPSGTVPAGSDSRGCGAVKSDGTFTFDFAPWSNTMERPDHTTLTMNTYPGKIDTHQIGAGYGNHFWFTHTRSPEAYPGNAGRLKVQGTWKLKAPLTNTTRQAKVYAHIPDHGAQTDNAVYRIQTANGERQATISQKRNQSNRWVSLGAYNFGDLIPEVRLDNFNGGTGDADIAFDAVAFVPGTFNGMTMAANLTTNPTAPAPAPVEPPTMAPSNFFPWRDGAIGDATNVTNAQNRDCDGWERTYSFTRTQGCVIDIVDASDGVLIGDRTVKWYYKHQFDLDPKSAQMTQKLEIKLNYMSSKANTATIDVKFGCGTGCSALAPFWDGSQTFNKGSTRVLKATQTTVWTGTGTQTIEPSWTYDVKVNGSNVVNPTTVKNEEWNPRCDNTVPNAGTGCIFPKYNPTYVMNSKKFPGAAAHIDLMWRKTNIKYGQRASGKPIKFLGNKTVPGGTKKQSTRNREIICGKSSVNFYPYLVAGAYNGTGDFSDLWGKQDAPSCDEFVFANGYQSAGNKNPGGTNPVTKNGSECVQTYLKRDSATTMSLHLRPDYPDPTWNEPCGRSSMSNWQNSQSMQSFPTFMINQRLMQDDKYWVDLDGFTAQ
ncbi:hypothetical protein [Streptomyces sp. NPDC090029]|uniref:golvesin C-terminal-like domain-containing protein n=1 Tax=Streptomyces sp. NPDC090029 TaxID=3365924 RepID=UPI00382FAE15